jgi:hypothetical protein
VVFGGPEDQPDTHDSNISSAFAKLICKSAAVIPPMLLRLDA